MAAKERIERLEAQNKEEARLADLKKIEGEKEKALQEEKRKAEQERLELLRRIEEEKQKFKSILDEKEKIRKDQLELLTVEENRLKERQRLDEEQELARHEERRKAEHERLELLKQIEEEKEKARLEEKAKAQQERLELIKQMEDAKEEALNEEKRIGDEKRNQLLLRLKEGKEKERQQEIAKMLEKEQHLQALQQVEEEKELARQEERRKNEDERLELLRQIEDQKSQADQDRYIAQRLEQELLDQLKRIEAERDTAIQEERLERLRQIEQEKEKHRLEHLQTLIDKEQGLLDLQKTLEEKDRLYHEEKLKADEERLKLLKRIEEEKDKALQEEKQKAEFEKQALLQKLEDEIQKAKHEEKQRIESERLALLKHLEEEKELARQKQLDAMIEKEKRLEELQLLHEENEKVMQEQKRQADLERLELLQLIEAEKLKVTAEAQNSYQSGSNLQQEKQKAIAKLLSTEAQKLYLAKFSPMSRLSTPVLDDDYHPMLGSLSLSPNMSPKSLLSPTPNSKAKNFITPETKPINDDDLEMRQVILQQKLFKDFSDTIKHIKESSPLVEDSSSTLLRYLKSKVLSDQFGSPFDDESVISADHSSIVIDDHVSNISENSKSSSVLEKIIKQHGLGLSPSARGKTLGPRLKAALETWKPELLPQEQPNPATAQTPVRSPLRLVHIARSAKTDDDDDDDDGGDVDDVFVSYRQMSDDVPVEPVSSSSKYGYLEEGEDSNDDVLSTSESERDNSLDKERFASPSNVPVISSAINMITSILKPSRSPSSSVSPSSSRPLSPIAKTAMKRSTGSVTFAESIEVLHFEKPDYEYEYSNEKNDESDTEYSDDDLELKDFDKVICHNEFDIGYKEFNERTISTHNESNYEYNLEDGSHIISPPHKPNYVVNIDTISEISEGSEFKRFSPENIPGIEKSPNTTNKTNHNNDDNDLADTSANTSLLSVLDVVGLFPFRLNKGMQSPQKKNIEFEEEGDDWIDPDVYREQDH